MAALGVFIRPSRRQSGSAHRTLDRLRKPGLLLLAVVLTFEGTSACHLKPNSPVGLQPTFSTDFKWSRGSLLPMKIEPPNTSVLPMFKTSREVIPTYPVKIPGD